MIIVAGRQLQQSYHAGNFKTSETIRVKWCRHQISCVVYIRLRRHSALQAEMKVALSRNECSEYQAGAGFRRLNDADRGC
jgi:hypothetical protein